jgi:6-phosphogluconate dehydrogenase
MLEPGDLLIDGGNTHFLDTERRSQELEAAGIIYIGTGVSGGEQGALLGPAIMPGGQPEAWELVKPIFEAIAAKAYGEPCVAYMGPRGAGPTAKIGEDPKTVTGWVGDALYAAKICSYAQGFGLMRLASREYGYDLNYGEIARIWRGGCIIRARFLNDIRESFARNPDLPNLMVDPEFVQAMNTRQSALRKAVALAAGSGIPALAFSSALAYYDAYRSECLPANLTQAQRDYFGAHTYRRIDRAGTFHTEWTSE